jgi:hypothetical protein
MLWEACQNFGLISGACLEVLVNHVALQTGVFRKRHGVTSGTDLLLGTMIAR